MIGREPQDAGRSVPLKQEKLQRNGKFLRAKQTTFPGEKRADPRCMNGENARRAMYGDEEEKT
jgi:hypothetical protein